VFQRITTRELVPGWEGMTHTAAQLAFLQGRSAFVLSGSWFVNEMRNSIPPDFELGAMNFPVFADGVGDPSALQGSSGYFFAFAKDDPPRTRLTVDFLRFLTSRERAAAFAGQLDAPVAVRGVTREAFSPLMQEFTAHRRTCCNRPDSIRRWSMHAARSRRDASPRRNSASSSKRPPRPCGRGARATPTKSRIVSRSAARCFWR
jgi:hypothetical protein